MAQRRLSQRIWYFFHIFNQIDLELERPNDSPRRNVVTQSSRAAALRSTAWATSLALVVGLSAWAADAAATSKVPLPKPRPIARNVVLKTTPAAKDTAKNTAKNSASPGSPAA